MLTATLFKGILLSLSCSLVHGSPAAENSNTGTPVPVKSSTSAATSSVYKKKAHNEAIRIPAATRVAAPIVPTISAKIDNIVVKLNTSSSAAKIEAPSQNVSVTSTAGTFLIFARNEASAYSAFSTLNGYGISYEVVLVPDGGIPSLPVLNSSATVGNYGAIVVLSEVSYNSPSGVFSSALTTDQWAALYQYQVTFAIRMVRLDVYPGPAFGTAAVGGCCDTGVEQLVSISNVTGFASAGLKTGAGLSTTGLWHYPATVTDSTIATEFAQFAPTTGFSDKTTAAVINNIEGRQQMVFFTGFATDWSATSSFLSHAWITWATRGLYSGYRRIHLNTQVDDMFLITELYSPKGGEYMLKPDDLDQYIPWQEKINAKLPTGSSYMIEIGHNGNGNIEEVTETETGEKRCGRGPIEYPEQIDTPLEFAKVLGTGTNLWPTWAQDYPYSSSCNDLGSLKKWFAKTENLNAFAHVSHTFTHEDQNNATYYDVTREISWNTAWLDQVGISSAAKFSPQGIIPPAITGMHNGDALRAWKDNDIIYVVGDNTRPVLMNKENEHWPLMTTKADNGFDGIQVNPRWASNIFYNCADPDCTVLEWQTTSAGKGDWYDLLELEKNTNVRHLLGLHHDPFMFHQANMNYLTAPEMTINGVTAKFSLLQAWVEVVVHELVRLINWPVISLKHDDMALAFLNRMERDQCKPVLSYTMDPAVKAITAVTLTATNNECNAKIPITVTGGVTDTLGFTTEQLGADPLTIWVQMTGSPVNFTLATPIPFYT